MCSILTFVGAVRRGADSDAIPVLAARFPIGTLCTGVSDAFCIFSWDVVVVSVARGAMPIAPECPKPICLMGRDSGGYSGYGRTAMAQFESSWRPAALLRLKRRSSSQPPPWLSPGRL